MSYILWLLVMESLIRGSLLPKKIIYYDSIFGRYIIYFRSRFWHNAHLGDCHLISFVFLLYVGEKFLSPTVDRR